MDAEALIRYGGFGLVCLLVFCSTGLFFCFFLPIGSVLFTVGVLAATGNLLPSIYTVCLLLSASALAGSITGYGIGRSMGNFFYTRQESRFFHRSYLTSTEEFYKKYGQLATIGSYYLPIIRTFAPVLAGIIKVKFLRFFFSSIVGSASFISLQVSAGYIIGGLPFLRPWLKYIVIFLVLAVTVPLVVKIVKTLKKPTEK